AYERTSHGVLLRWRTGEPSRGQSLGPYRAPLGLRSVGPALATRSVPCQHLYYTMCTWCVSRGLTSNLTRITGTQASTREGTHTHPRARAELTAGTGQDRAQRGT